MPEKIPGISRMPVEIKINDNQILKGEFVRHFSPLTIKKLIEHFPLNERIHNYQNKFVYIKLDLDLGVEKPLKSFKKGDIAFSPSGSFICFFLTDYIHYQSMNYIGTVPFDSLESLKNTKTGDILKIDKEN